MSDETLTPREVRLCREAVLVGVRWREMNPVNCRSNPLENQPEETVAKAAAYKYPMPTVTVPRVVRWNEDQYRLVNGMLQHRTSDRDPWIDASRILQRTNAINDVLANPTEQRPADEATP